ncbi:MAG TPA: DUF763 domain-containing protein [Firmicutes bacterium]|nr:DUF763 domain-containing protein [Bacillota bacterium]
MRSGTANLPLHSGKCPAWLFSRMKLLGAAIIEIIVEEFGPQEVLQRLSDPVWFQALGCVLGFDWHSSGITTTVCGALKEGLRPREGDLGIFFAGGKGATSRKTPLEISDACERHGLPSELLGLQYASKMAAKVDSAALQDGYDIYHHLFVFTADGKWAVVQQGMNEATGWARRYHWIGQLSHDFSFVCEPHAGISCDHVHAGKVLNMVAAESEEARKASAWLAREETSMVLGEVRKVLSLPASHAIPGTARLEKTLRAAYEHQPEDFETLLSVPGVGPATIRALAMVAEVAYGASPSRRDPVRYSFAHGGKDGHPFPVNRANYDRSIQVLEDALRRARLGQTDKLKALRRLAAWREGAEGGYRGS